VKRFEKVSGIAGTYPLVGDVRGLGAMVEWNWWWIEDKGTGHCPNQGV